MLPDYETCWKHITAFKKRVKAPGPNAISFPDFWYYKTGVENSQQNILDDDNIEATSARLYSLLVYLRGHNAGVAEAKQIEHFLRNIRSYYSEINRVRLGSGDIHFCRGTLESIYANLGSTTNINSKSSIVGKSEILMAIWGQIPRFDSLIRRRFERWTHSPGPEKLPYIKSNKTWYKPEEFIEIIEKLDDWVRAWPENNEGKSFENSFQDICPGIPPGRQIDIIYHWKLPDPWVDYKLRSIAS